jgi:predicted secreted hydrolase
VAAVTATASRRLLLRAPVVPAAAWLGAHAAWLLPQTARAQPAPVPATAGGYAAVSPRALAFPADHGAHPAFRVEWWYLTAVLAREATAASSRDFADRDFVGVQVTFFRVRTPVDLAHAEHPSRFAARHLLIAHAAIADPARGSLLHEQRIARVGPGGTSFDTQDTALALDGWTLRRDPQAAAGYACDIGARTFRLNFAASARAPRLLHGANGTLRKTRAGDAPDAAASHYYSWPQLALSALVERDGRIERRSGPGWLDHEWASHLLDPDAAGWDWAGMNLDDGGALVVYRFRRKEDGRPLYTYATLRATSGDLRTFTGTQAALEPIEHWTSPRTRARYPVALRIRIGERTFETRPLMPDQELDGRATTGQVYWEGASLLIENGRRVGRGYVELTGYAAPMNL